MAELRKALDPAAATLADIPAFKTIGLPIAVADAYPEIFPHVLYRTIKFGGHGAVREVCDLIFHAKKGILIGQVNDVP